MNEETAETLTGMMTDVVNEGTGGAAALASDPGRRQDGNRGDRHPSEGSTRPGSSASRPRTIPRSRSPSRWSAPDRFGGDVAAPIAQQVLEVLTRGRGMRIEPDGGARKGTIVDERYQLIRKIGTGGMADVWLAEDTELDREVAIKILHDRFAQDKEFVERFRREAQSAAGLQHPNVVSIFDRGEFGDTYFIAMEYVEGPQLKDLVKGGMETQGRDRLHAPDPQRRPLRPPQGDRPPRPEAPERPHRRRRTGPGRRLRHRPGRGLRHHPGRLGDGDRPVPLPGAGPGQGRTAASDIYSIGVILYEALTGRVPFEGTAPSPSPSSRSPRPRGGRARSTPSVPPALDAVVMRALAKDPGARFKDADAFVKALDAAERAPDKPRPEDTAAFAAARPRASTRPPPRRRTGRGLRGPARRRRWWRWALLARWSPAS